MPTAAIAAQGGHARAAALTAEQRSASARKAVQQVAEGPCCTWCPWGARLSRSCASDSVRRGHDV